MPRQAQIHLTGQEKTTSISLPQVILPPGVDGGLIADDKLTPAGKEFLGAIHLLIAGQKLAATGTYTYRFIVDEATLVSDGSYPSEQLAMVQGKNVAK